MVLVVALALAAACCFGTSSVLEQYAASAEPPERSLRLGLLASLARRPVWLFGVASEGVANLLQAAALATGSLLVVQPLLTTGLLFALPLGAWLRRRRLGSREWIGATAVACGLSCFLAFGGATVGEPHPTHRASVIFGMGADRIGENWLICGGIVLALAAVLVAASHRGSDWRRPVLLATAAGLVAGLTDALVKTTTGVLGDEGVTHLLVNWRPYATACVGLLLMLLSQSAYQAGPLARSLPALAAVEPVAAAALGVALFDERLATSGPALLAEAGGAGLMLAGIVLLARSPLVIGDGPGGARPLRMPRRQARSSS